MLISQSQLEVTLRRFSKKMKQNSNILVLGALGQIGCELTNKLRDHHGSNSVIASDIKSDDQNIFKEGPFEQIDAMDYNQILTYIKHYKIDTVYLMAAMLSANSEKHPYQAWMLNVSSLLHVLNLAKEGYIKTIFWPSSIAVFGPTTPKINVPQQTITAPTTVYGISKLAGEGWCAYYHNKFGVDVRSLRYPGIVSWQSMPGGGTTDYAVDIFHKAVNHQSFTCFLKSDTRLPMMYMDDALEATIKIMNSDANKLTVRTSYNLAALSFTPREIFSAIKLHYPNFSIDYKPDFRQYIADSWPESIDDSVAKNDWGWESKFNLEQMTYEMLKHLELKSKKT